jgi:hypothetical protein
LEDKNRMIFGRSLEDFIGKIGKIPARVSIFAWLGILLVDFWVTLFGSQHYSGTVPAKIVIARYFE